jgi:archaellum component FlaC
MEEKNTKSMTLDKLATMVAGGFNDMGERMDKIENRIDKIDNRMGSLEHKVEALNSNVNNYLELSEKRYAELKQNDALLAKWIKLVAEKTGVPIDVSQLEKI